jgi:hypothetical protein
LSAYRFKDVGKVDQFGARIIGKKIVQGDHVTGLLQPLQSGFHKIVGGNRFENLDYGKRRRQKSDVVFEQDFARAIYERAFAVARRQAVRYLPEQ